MPEPEAAEAGVSAKPADFFVTVIDFFAVLLPGAIFTALYGDAIAAALGIPTHTENGILLPEVSARDWVVFIVAAYLFGHFMFLISSFFDPLYDALRKRIVPLAKDKAFTEVDRLRKEHLAGAADAFNALKWSKTYLQLRHREALAAVERLEADSKFFRSLIPVLLLSLPLLVARGAIGPAVTAFVLVLLSFWRFADQRWKASQLAYRMMIELLRTSSLS